MAYDRIEIMNSKTGDIIGCIPCPLPEFFDMRDLRDIISLETDWAYSLIWANAYTPLRDSIY